MGWLYQYNRRETDGSLTSIYFCAALDGSDVRLYKLTAGEWNEVTAVGTLANWPQAVTLANLLHLSDGRSAWLFDGTEWVEEGIERAGPAPAIDAGGAGALDITSNRFYWTTYSDEGVNDSERAHQSSSTDISEGTGPLTDKKVRVYQQPGAVTASEGSTLVTGDGTAFDQAVVALSRERQWKLYVDVGGVMVDFGIVVSFTISPAQTLTLVDPAPNDAADAHFLILPARCSKWYVYASEAEESRVGLLLAEIPAVGADSSAYYDDESPWAGNPDSLFSVIERPYRNDKPPASKILNVYRNRIFRRREARPNYFIFSAYEEVEGAQSGAGNQCTPGTDSNTISDLVNESSIPDESSAIRAMCSHGQDALYMGTESQILPLYGDSRDSFGFSQVDSFAVGVAGRYAMVSTPYGLVFLSYDRHFYLYPSFDVPTGESTASLVDLGRPISKKLERVLASDLDNVRLCFYNWGRRSWLLVAYLDKTAVRHLWGYDFNATTWFEFQQGQDLGIVSLGVWEIPTGDSGNRVLVGGCADGYVYVIDDLTETVTVVNADHPAAIFRPALIDFANPAQKHVVRYVEWETSSADLVVTASYWLDPADVDNPGDSIELIPTLSPVGGYRYRAFIRQGGVCQRLLLELALSSDDVSGVIRSFIVKADPVSELAV